MKPLGLESLGWGCIRHRVNGRVRDQSAVAMVEATLGVLMLVSAALMAIQVVLVVHGALNARLAAQAVARELALTQIEPRAQMEFEKHKNLSMNLIWDPVELEIDPPKEWARAVVRVKVPAVFPGAALLFGEDRKTGIPITEDAKYPLGGAY